MYKARITALKNLAFKHAKSLWGQPDSRVTFIEQNCDLSQLSESECNDVVIGGLFLRLYKRMTPISDILMELAETDTARMPKASHCSHDDEFVLEDETSRVALAQERAERGTFEAPQRRDADETTKQEVVAASVNLPSLSFGDLRDIPSGCVIALRGRFVDSTFIIRDAALPREAPERLLLDELSLSAVRASPRPLVAALSGLTLGGDGLSSARVDLLSEALTGPILRAAGGRLTAVLLGNSLAAPEDTADGRRALSDPLCNRSIVLSKLTAPVGLFDRFLRRLTSAGVQVVLLPGSDDPTDFSLPQMPLSAALFPLAGASEHLQLHTNPSCTTLLGKTAVLTAGRAVADIQAATGVGESGNDALFGPDSAIRAVMKSLSACHLAPTAPQTLDCATFTKDEGDPFVLKTFPELFLFGNQAEASFARLTLSGRACVALGVPAFSRAGQIALLDPAAARACAVTLEVES
eukprot:gnl/Chilomastix_cuspidata/2877.p1 GENE.gnl/Chilomastix_cuspidata/2877~~gnl/Chilomastix_cuspidata/2877.p1  ORF type:complete len:504 (-),score=102.56 gnl/Chilomastix_cuspidata/2877:593-1993(-)